MPLPPGANASIILAKVVTTRLFGSDVGQDRRSSVRTGTAGRVPTRRASDRKIRAKVFGATEGGIKMCAHQMWLSPWHLRDVLKSLHVWRFAGAAFALLLSWPAAAQTTTYCDSTFNNVDWMVPLQYFSNPAGGSVSGIFTPAGGTSIVPALPCLPNNSYRSVTDVVPANGSVLGVHIYNPTSGLGTYNPKTSGAIATIAVSIDYECPNSNGSCPNTEGQAFGPALMQNGKYFVANKNGSGTNQSSWTSFPGSPLTAADFYEVQANGTTNSTNPDFSGAGAPINCGFYTANSSSGAGYTNHAGYDNWVCTITPVGYLKVCKVAGPGVAVGTSFTFTTGSSKFTVPAGPAPGGTCAIGPSLPVGTNVTVTEAIPSGDAVSSITAAPPGQLVSENLAAGTVTVTIGSGVTEVTYTDYATMGYLEICKQGDLDTKGNFTFTVNPGNWDRSRSRPGIARRRYKSPLARWSSQKRRPPASSCPAAPPSPRANRGRAISLSRPRR